MRWQASRCASSATSPPVRTAASAPGSVLPSQQPSFFERSRSWAGNVQGLRRAHHHAKAPRRRPGRPRGPVVADRESRPAPPVQLVELHTSICCGSTCRTYPSTTGRQHGTGVEAGLSDHPPQTSDVRADFAHRPLVGELVDRHHLPGPWWRSVTRTAGAALDPGSRRTRAPVRGTSRSVSVSTSQPRR